MHFVIGFVILAILVFTSLGRKLLLFGCVAGVLAFWYYASQPDPAAPSAQTDCRPVEGVPHGSILDKIIHEGCPGYKTD